MITYTYPQNAELRAIEPTIVARVTRDDPIFQHFPIVNSDADVLMWEMSDSMGGLQGVRGLNGEPTRIKSVGASRYVMEPGYYGEFASIDEVELTRRRPIGGFTGTVNITDLVREKQDLLIMRETQRIRTICWTLATTGTFSVLDLRGQILHTDKYTIPTATAAVSWATVATATPIADFRAVRVASRGKSVQFDTGATAYMNLVTWNKLISNRNQDDLAGRRVSGLLSPLTGDEVKRILLEEGLPQVVIFDDGWWDEDMGWTPYIPDNKVVIFGRRTTGTSLGEYRMTRNANNPDLSPGSYVNVVDSIQQGNPVPRRIEVHRGHNGGPVIFYSDGIMVMSV